MHGFCLERAENYDGLPPLSDEISVVLGDSAGATGGGCGVVEVGFSGTGAGRLLAGSALFPGKMRVSEPKRRYFSKTASFKNVFAGPL